MAEAETKNENGGTALAKKEESKFVALRGGVDVATLPDEAAAEDVTVNDLPRIKMPTGGGLFWTVPHPSGDKPADAIEGVLCMWQKCGVLWPKDGEASAGTMPVLLTYDLRTAMRVNQDDGDLDPDVLANAALGDGRYDWLGTDAGGKNAYNAWGSGRDGVGKRCKERRMVGVLSTDAQFPVIINIGPGSLKPVTAFIKSLQMEGIPWWRCIVRWTLRTVTAKTSGIEYSQAVPELVGQVTPAEGDIVLARYVKPLGAAMRDWVPTFETNGD